MLAILSAFARRFRAANSVEGCVSFDGLLSLTRRLLRSTTFPGVRERIEGRYDFILVNELEDTDPLRCEILLLGE